MEQYNIFPMRIISLVPSQTELLYDLGLDKEIVGITKFCIHPEHWFSNKTRVGGTKTADIKLISQLKPDLVIANKEENIKEQIEAIQEFSRVYVSNISTVEQALDMIQEVGKLTGRAEEADKLYTYISSQFAFLHQNTNLRVAYFIWRNPWMTIGNDTFIHDIISKAGWENIYNDQKRYPVTSLEELVLKNPDIVFLSSEPYPFKEKHIHEIRRFLPNTKIILVDGEMFSWYGSRMKYTPTYILKLAGQLI